MSGFPYGSSPDKIDAVFGAGCSRILLSLP